MNGASPHAIRFVLYSGATPTGSVAGKFAYFSFFAKMLPAMLNEKFPKCLAHVEVRQTIEMTL